MQHISLAPSSGVKTSQGCNSNMHMVRMTSNIITDNDNIRSPASRNAVPGLHTTIGASTFGIILFEIFAARLVRLSYCFDHTVVSMDSSDHSCTSLSMSPLHPNDDMDNNYRRACLARMTMLANLPGSPLCICPRTVQLVVCASGTASLHYENEARLNAYLNAFSLVLY